MRRIATLPLMIAAAFPAIGTELKDVEYGRVGTHSLRMDAHIPTGSTPHPALILVHGGGWMRGDRTWNVQPLFHPFAAAGFAWFSVSYRLATDFMNFGEAVEDIRQAVRHLRENAARYHIDPNRIALVGESAGGHLASLAALADTKSVAAVVAMYSPSDLELLARTSAAVPPQVRQAVEASGWAELLIGHLRSLSPIEHVRGDAPPFLLVHGTADTVVPYEQSIRMQARLKAAGVPCELIDVRGGGHGFRYWDRSPSQSGYLQQMITWLHRRLSA